MYGDTELDHVNFEKLAQFFYEDLGGDQATFDSIIQILEDQFSEFLAYQFSSDDLESLGKMAHKIRSGARSFALESSYNGLSELERLCREQLVEASQDEVTRLQSLLPLAMSELQQCRLQLYQKVQHG